MMRSELYSRTGEFTGSCVDGPRLARCFGCSDDLVGALMCPASRCGAHDRGPDLTEFLNQAK